MTGTKKWQARSAAANNVSFVERSYPGADDNTAQFVKRLRQRGITDPRAGMRRTSRALIEDAYRGTSPEHTTGQMPKTFDNNYSPYSNVNAEAAQETARRQAEAKRRAEIERRRQLVSRSSPAPKNPASAGTMNRAPAKTANAAGRVRAPGEAHRIEPAKRANTAMARPKRKFENGQIAESGPREMAVKHVPFPKFAFVIIFMFVVLFFMVQSFVTNYEYKRDIAALQRQVEELEVKRDQLLSELEQRDDLAAIEDRAEELGMIKGGGSGEKYIDLSGGDVVENIGGENEKMGSFTTLLSAVRHRLSRFLGTED